MFSTPALDCKKDFRNPTDGVLTRFPEDFATVHRETKEMSPLARSAV
jgi:hypothetical protein